MNPRTGPWKKPKACSRKKRLTFRFNTVILKWPPSESTVLKRSALASGERMYVDVYHLLLLHVKKYYIHEETEGGLKPLNTMVLSFGNV